MIAKRGFSCDDNYYYLYIDKGKKEAEEVSVNFLRDFGEIWGKVVRKDQTSSDEAAKWRIYRISSADFGDSFHIIDILNNSKRM